MCTADQLTHIQPVASKPASSQRRSVSHSLPLAFTGLQTWQDSQQLKPFLFLFLTSFLTIPKLLVTEFWLFLVNRLRASSTRPLHQTFTGRQGKHRFQPRKRALLDPSRKQSRWREGLRGHVWPGVVRTSTERPESTHKRMALQETRRCCVSSVLALHTDGGVPLITQATC